MGTGAVLDYQHIPGDTADEPNEILVALRPGADLAAARARLQCIVPIADGGVFSGVQRPAEITDYRSMGVAPLILTSALAVGAVASLWLTLAASVRRRRADLALLKTLGLTGRQLATTVACQSTVTVAAGALIGVPLGIALRRYLWVLFARQIRVVPEPSVLVLRVIAVIAGPWRRRTWSWPSLAAPPPEPRPPPCCGRSDHDGGVACRALSLIAILPRSLSGAVYGGDLVRGLGDHVGLAGDAELAESGQDPGLDERAEQLFAVPHVGHAQNAVAERGDVKAHPGGRVAVPAGSLAERVVLAGRNAVPCLHDDGGHDFPPGGDVAVGR
jgi:hypothetical protein